MSRERWQDNEKVKDALARVLCRVCPVCGHGVTWHGENHEDGCSHTGCECSLNARECDAKINDEANVYALVEAVAACVDAPPLPEIREPTKYDQVPNGCWAACLAGLTGIPHGELSALVPAVLPGEADPPASVGCAYNNAMLAKLREHGWTFAHLGSRVPRGFAIGNGKSERGIFHAVIVKDGVLWHDPHPSRAGCEVVEYEIVVALASSTAPPRTGVRMEGTSETRRP